MVADLKGAWVDRLSLSKILQVVCSRIRWKNHVTI